MEDSVQRVFWMGLSLIVLSAVISMISITMTVFTNYTEAVVEAQAVAEQMGEQRNNMFYQETHVYQQDIVNYIFRYKGERSVTVRLTTLNKTYTWSNAVQASEYKISAVSGLLPRDLIYDSVLVYGPSGRDVIGVEFVECPSNTGGTCPL